jgi:DNA-binding beta-propeller fold protein YncE
MRPMKTVWKALAGPAPMAIVAAVTLSLSVSAQGGTSKASTRAGGVPTFQVEASWPQKLPNNWVMGVPSWVAVDARDHVWVLHRPRTLSTAEQGRAAPAVLEFDEAGRFVQGWGGPSDRYEWPDLEHGIFVDHQNRVWIGGINPIAGAEGSQRWDDMLLVFTRTGTFVRQIGRRDKSGGNEDTKNVKRPADVFVYPKTHEAFVADGYGNRRVLVLDADTGAFKRMWGAFGNRPVDAPPLPPGVRRPVPPLLTEGPGPDQFDVVHALILSNDGLVYVADRQNRRIQVFTLEGRFVTQVFINRTGPYPRTGSGLAFSPDPQQQFMYVADFDNGQVVIVNRKTLDVVGSFGRRGSSPGEFQSLHNIAADSKGNLYTAEVGPGSRVQKFRFQGLSGPDGR